jgi:hypothetical protein
MVSTYIATFGSCSRIGDFSYESESRSVVVCMIGVIVLISIGHDL